MQECPGCGTRLTDGSSPCALCGAPTGQPGFVDDTPTSPIGFVPLPPLAPPGAPRSASWLPAGIAMGAIAGAVALVAVLAAHPGRSTAAAEPTDLAVVSPHSYSPTPDHPTDTGTQDPYAQDQGSLDPYAGQSSSSAEPDPDTGTSSDTSSDTGAKAALDREVAADRELAESLDGHWVPELSAKKVGLEANGTTYDHVSIWQDFSDLKQRYPDAILLWSGDFRSFRYDDFWITVRPDPATGSAAPNGWCDSESIPVDDCFAKLVSHSHGYDGSVKMRSR